MPGHKCKSKCHTERRSREDLSLPTHTGEQYQAACPPEFRESCHYSCGTRPRTLINECGDSLIPRGLVDAIEPLPLEWIEHPGNQRVLGQSQCLLPGGIDSDLLDRNVRHKFTSSFLSPVLSTNHRNRPNSHSLGSTPAMELTPHPLTQYLPPATAFFNIRTVCSPKTH